MRISEYLSPTFVVPHLESRDVDGVLHELSARAAAAGVGPASVIAEKLLERELAHTSVMGAGLAIPHATVPGISNPVIGVARSYDPIHFGPPELDPVRVFFVLLSPPGHERMHVKLLARICRLARNASFLSEISAADSDKAIVEVVQSMDAKHA
jgi:nitrogen PTS system EIIA component